MRFSPRDKLFYPSNIDSIVLTVTESPTPPDLTLLRRMHSCTKCDSLHGIYPFYPSNIDSIVLTVTESPTPPDLTLLRRMNSCSKCDSLHEINRFYPSN